MTLRLGTNDVLKYVFNVTDLNLAEGEEVDQSLFSVSSFVQDTDINSGNTGNIVFQLHYNGQTIAQTVLAGAQDRLALLSQRYEENFSYEAFIAAMDIQNGIIEIDASIMLERANQVIDLTSSNVVTGGIDGDIFVLAGSDTTAGAGDDLVIGGIGSDRYEVRILSEDNDGNAVNLDRGNVVINELGRNNGIEEDSILFEGVSSIADLSFTRTTVAGEGEGQSLQIGYQLTMSEGDGDLNGGFGTVELFNQYSFSQSHLYNVENLQIMEEAENTLEAPVSEYSFGDVLGATNDGGDILSASGSDNAILVGHAALADEFRVDLLDINKDVWLYGFDNELDTVSLQLNASTALSPISSSGSWTRK